VVLVHEWWHEWVARPLSAMYRAVDRSAVAVNLDLVVEQALEQPLPPPLEACRQDPPRDRLMPARDLDGRGAT
jgi:hypothetical protein